MALMQEMTMLQSQGVMLHREWKNAFNFLGFQGYKRWHECRMFEELCTTSECERALIDKCYMLPGGGHFEGSSIIKTLKELAMWDIPSVQKKEYIKALFTEWKDWEVKVRSFYNKAYKWAVDNEHSSKLMFEACLKGVCEEILRIDREHMDCINMGWDLPQIVNRQESIHDEYEEKTSKYAGRYVG